MWKWLEDTRQRLSSSSLHSPRIKLHSQEQHLTNEVKKHVLHLQQRRLHTSWVKRKPNDKFFLWTIDKLPLVPLFVAAERSFMPSDVGQRLRHPSLNIIVWYRTSSYDVQLNCWKFFIWMSPLRSIVSFSRGYKYRVGGFIKASKRSANFFSTFIISVMHHGYCVMPSCPYTPEVWATPLQEQQQQRVRRHVDSLWIPERRGRSRWHRRSRLRCRRCRPRCSPRRGIPPDTSRCSIDLPIRPHRCTLPTEGGSWETGRDRKSVGSRSMLLIFVFYCINGWNEAVPLENLWRQYWAI